jgi:hypothetical protein
MSPIVGEARNTSGVVTRVSLMQGVEIANMAKERTIQKLCGERYKSIGSLLKHMARMHVLYVYIDGKSQ